MTTYIRCPQCGKFKYNRTGQVCENPYCITTSVSELGQASTLEAAPSRWGWFRWIRWFPRTETSPSSKREGIFAHLDSRNDPVRRKAADRLEEDCDSTHVDALLDSMTSADWYVRWKVLDVLGGLREPKAFPVALEALHDKNAGVREAAVEALGNIGDPSAARAVTAALSDNNEQVRAKAARALANLGKTEDLRPLLKTLNDRSASVRIAAAQSLVSIGDQHAAAPLGAAAAEEADPLTRCAFAEAAAKLGDSLGRTILENLANSENYYAREAAGAALKRL